MQYSVADNMWESHIHEVYNLVFRSNIYDPNFYLLYLNCKNTCLTHLAHCSTGRVLNSDKVAVCVYSHSGKADGRSRNSSGVL